VDESTWLAELYDAHAPGLYRYALMILSDKAGAEDAVQAAFAGLIGAGSSVRSPLDYLRRSVRNGCFSELRQRARYGETRTSTNGCLLEPIGPEAGRREERLALDRAVRRLPAEQREVLYLKVYEGLSFREIADVVEVPLSTAASRYRYALEKLRELLGTSE
jgi:RNA polymerase sigma-70 factor (ECF subfamily)